MAMPIVSLAIPLASKYDTEYTETFVECFVKIW